MYHIVIPARFAATRLPGKPLLDIAGHPMVWWVWKAACQASANSVVVATDDERIAAVMTHAGADVAVTRPDHPSGTDRLAEVVDQRGWSPDSIVVNLQGDEPLMPVVNLEQVAGLLAKDTEASIATLSEPLESYGQLDDPSVVKVVVNQQGRALFFSRSAIPRPRDLSDATRALTMNTARRHVGLYAYRARFLKDFVTWPTGALERLEGLEQLRALEQGRLIAVAPAKQSVPPGVDTQADLDRVRAELDAQ